MGCNCGKKKTPATPSRPGVTASARPSGQWRLSVGGVSQTYGSKLEADAANVRTGNRGTVRPV